MSTPGGISFWTIVGRQLRKKRLAMFGYRCIVGLFLLATFAPLIASDLPFYYRDAGGASSPWLEGLFDRVAVPQAVDLFFNLMLLFLPPASVAFLLLRFACRARGSWSARAMRRTIAAMTGLFLWLFLGVYLPDPLVRGPGARVLLAPGLGLRSSRPAVDYHALAAERRAAGHEIVALFPPVPYSYSLTRVRESVLPPDWFVGSARADLGAVGIHPLGTDAGGRDVFTALL
ncbi:MAG: hypothetical protein ACREID_02525 [Planctomycetota bacterium]